MEGGGGSFGPSRGGYFPDFFRGERGVLRTLRGGIPPSVHTYVRTENLFGRCVKLLTLLQMFSVLKTVIRQRLRIAPALITALAVLYNMITTFRSNDGESDSDNDGDGSNSSESSDNSDTDDNAEQGGNDTALRPDGQRLNRAAVRAAGAEKRRQMANDFLSY